MKNIEKLGMAKKTENVSGQDEQALAVPVVFAVLSLRVAVVEVD